MWGLGNISTDGRSAIPMASYHEVMMREIHVLLVDHDSEGLVNTAKLLEICQYRVTFVELASAAISILLSGKAKFDVVMANINSPDLHGFKLLQQAVAMALPVVLMSGDDNTFTAMRALENGAFLCIKKPTTMEMLRCLWQHVLREKTRMIRERDLLVASNHVHGARGIEFREMIHPKEENPNKIVNGATATMIAMNDNGKFKKRRNDADEGYEVYDSENHKVINSNVRRKMCTEWTPELHAKFMNAVEQLGEGRCFPKDILELMNVPGLTRMQVASHLQKCRNDNWRSPEERKPKQATQPASTDTNGSQPKPRRFGSKPQLGKAEPGRSSETYSGTDQMPNNGRHIGKMGILPVVTNSTSHDQHYGSFGPGPSNARPGATSSDKFLNMPDMDCLIQNLPGQRQGSGINNPNSGHGAPYNNFNPASNHHEQNTGGAEPSMDTRSQWSSATSSFESHHSETTAGHEQY